MYSIHDEDNVKKIFKENDIKQFRYSQLENAIYKNFILDFDDIKTIPKSLRELLKDNFYYFSLKLKKKLDSQNKQTTKLLFETKTWELIESVIMRHLTWRVTLCVSCQVGCPMWCTFCATWKLGLKRNLKFYEIVEQIYFASNLLEGDWEKLRNVVYMWMWEPFLNYESVKKSINIITNQKKINLANRRITVSTCWIIPWIKEFTKDFPQTSLAISLHAPNDKIRSVLMPVSKKYPLKELMNVLDNYVKETNKKVFYEYIMISWVNDNIFLARELGELLKWKLAHVNFIPYNSGEGDWNYKQTPRFIIEKFQKILLSYWVMSTIRTTMWDDIDAACWQLATKNK